MADTPNTDGTSIDMLAELEAAEAALNAAIPAASGRVYPSADALAAMTDADFLTHYRYIAGLDFQTDGRKGAGRAAGLTGHRKDIRKEVLRRKAAAQASVASQASDMTSEGGSDGSDG